MVDKLVVIEDEIHRIRLAKPDEIPILQEIERAGGPQFLRVGHPELAGDHTISTEVALRSLAQESLYVVEVANRICGWVGAEVEGVRLHVEQISVHPDYQQRGLGTALMEFVINEAEQRGFESLVLDTQTDVAWNQPWYQQLGFQVVAADQWTAQMVETTAAQVAAGLDWSTRVHMRLCLGRS